ncbi:MAG: tyrosine-type recombinase/integrase [Rhodospirillaceae bacterium]
MTRETQKSADTIRTRRITDRAVQALPCPDRGSQIHYDSQLRGFGVRVMASGLKSFVLNYRLRGRERRFTIGRYPEWTVNAARRRAAEVRCQVDAGVDPLGDRQRAYEAPTVKEMFERVERDYLPRLAKKTQFDYRSAFTRRIFPRMGSMKVADVTFSDCEAMHRAISKTAPTAANRTIACLRRNFNLAMTWGWIDRNPTRGIEFNRENKREHYLTPEEIGRVLKALDEHWNQDSCDAIRIMIFTGCRRSEAMGARWDQFDPDFRVWTKPAATTKQRRIHRVPVSPEVTRILRRRQQGADTPFVFPSINGRALKEVRKTWLGVQKSANVEGTRLHDLRHTFASIAVSTGHSLPIVGAMLGHTQPQTTARYAHLMDQVLVEATVKVSAKMLG